MPLSSKIKNRYKFRLITKPAVTLAIWVALVMLVLFAIPVVFESQLNRINIGGNQLDFSIAPFPLFVYIFVPIVTSLPLITKLVGNIMTYSKWKNGDSPPCPNCSAPMKQRIAKRGQFVGQKFWGCSTYPVCTGKEHIGW